MRPPRPPPRAPADSVNHGGDDLGEVGVDAVDLSTVSDGGNNENWFTAAQVELPGDSNENDNGNDSDDSDTQDSANENDNSTDEAADSATVTTSVDGVE